MDKKLWNKILKENKLNEADFNEEEFEKLVTKAFVQLYTGLNTLESIIPNYLKRVGKKDMITSFLKKYNIKQLHQVIDKSDVE